jgi:predicted amidophosphoribosyltransferase
LSVANQCPVCQARFRGAAICSRCGADLGRLMRLAAQGWWLREAARAALSAGELGRVLELAAKAQEAQGTPAGEALLRVGYWLEAKKNA